MICPAPDEGQVALRCLALLLPLQQIQIAADGGEGGAEIVGDVGHRLFQVPVAVLILLPLPAELAQLDIEASSQTAHGAVPAGDGQECVGVRFQTLLDAAAKLLRRAAEKPELPEQKQYGDRQQGAQHRKNVHHPRSLPYFTAIYTSM